MTELNVKEPTRVEKLDEIDTSAFIILMDKIVEDESLPNRVITVEYPRQEAILRRVIVFKDNTRIECECIVEPAGELAIDPKKLVTMLRIMAEFDNTRVEVITIDGKLRAAACLDMIRDDNTDRQASKNTYESSVVIIELALEDLKS